MPRSMGAYFAGAPEEELGVLYMNEPLLKDVLSYEKVFTNNDDMYRKYQQREDAIRDEQTKIAMSERRGIGIGIMQSAINGLKKGYSLDTISDITGLTIDEIKAIKY